MDKPTAVGISSDNGSKASRPRYNSLNKGTFEEILEENENGEEKIKNGHHSENNVGSGQEQKHAEDTPAPILKHGEKFLEEHKSLKHGDTPSDPVDNYYAKNYYTVTGGMEGENFQKIPKSHKGNDRAVSIASCGRNSFRSVRPTEAGEKITEREFDKSVYWLTYNSKRFGFRHFGFILIVLAYSFLGATFFYLIESRNEQQVIASRVLNMERAMEDLGSDLSQLINDPSQNRTKDEMKEHIKSTYIKLLNIEGAYRWTTYFKLEDPENNYKWTWGSALFFCMNVYTTTGYGSIAPETRIAQYVVILYGFIFVPLTLVVVRSMGQLALVFFTTTYARMLVRLRQFRGYPDAKDDEIISLPLKFGILIALVYWMICSIFIYEYDRLSGPPGSGIEFFGSVYFSFISLSTIGLGDVMPNNVQFRPIITTIFFLGIPLIKVVNRALYLSIENGIFALFALIENRLMRLVEGKSQKIERSASVRSGRTRKPSIGAKEAQTPVQEAEIGADWANTLTIRSVAQFMRSNSDIYGGGYGRIDLRRSELLPNTNTNRHSSNNQHTVTSLR